MKQVLTREEVAKVMEQFKANGKRTTLAALHAALGNRGSTTTLIKLKSEVEAAALMVVDSQEGLKAFREVWALAVEEGRKQQEFLIAELRETIQTLLVENQQLEGVAAAAQGRASELEKVKCKAESDLAEIRSKLSQAQAAVIEIGGQARQALEQLAKEQAARVSESAQLRTERDKAIEKGHLLALDLAACRALLEKKGSK